MQVKLTYFKKTGKYYSEGSYDTTLTQNDNLESIWSETRALFFNGIRPGLCNGEQYFIALVDVPEHPNNGPHLIMPREEQGVIER